MASETLSSLRVSMYGNHESRGAHSADYLYRFLIVQDITNDTVRPLITDMMNFLKTEAKQTPKMADAVVYLQIMNCVSYFNNKAQRYITRFVIEQVRNSKRSSESETMVTFFNAVEREVRNSNMSIGGLGRYGEFWTQVKFG